MGGTGIARCLVAALALVAGGRLTAQADGTEAAGEPARAPLAPVADDAAFRALLARMCSADGAFQFAFGQTGVPGSSPIERLTRSNLVLPALAAPFVRAEPRATKWSDRFYSIDFTFISEGDPDEELADLYERADAALALDGWQLRPADYDPPLYKFGGDGWYKPAGTGPDAAEVMLELSELGGEITLSCARSDLTKLALQEEFGDLPPGTPRPLEPTLPMVPVPTAADCVRPEVAAEIDAFLESGKPDSFTRSIMRRADYHDRLSQWMMWRLEQAGADRDELFRMAMDAAMLDGGAQGLTGSLDTFLELLPVIGKLSEAQKAADRDGVCRGFVDVTSIYSRLAENGAAQTRALVEAYRREAPRFGIDPDE